MISLKKKFIVYFPFHLKSGESGSGVRPTQLLNAFHQLAEEKNMECIEIIGSSQERKQKLNDLYQNVDPSQIEFCYMENQTIPIWLTDSDHLPRAPFLDLNFMKFLKKNDIPLGIFYRDVYWKFKQHYQVSFGIKQAMISLFHLELLMYKRYAKKIFLPSTEMNKYLSVPGEQLSTSPPGGKKIQKMARFQEGAPNAVYVGGINPRYGIYEVLKAFRSINSSDTRISLSLVCRKHEFDTYRSLMEEYLEAEWLTIHHAHGEQLTPIYEKADFGIVTLQKEVYNDFAVPVKLFEYLSYGLPVLATNCNALERIVKEDSLGVIVPDNSKDIEIGILELLDENKRSAFKKQVELALQTKHLWIHRAEDIRSALLSQN